FALPLMEGLRIMVRVALRSMWQDWAFLVLGHHLVPTRRGSQSVMFEHQPLAIRRQAMRIIWDSLQKWPNHLLKTLRRAGIPRYAFKVERREVPFWLQSALDELPGVQPRIVNREEWLSACRWLQKQGIAVTRAALLKAVDPGVSPFGQPHLPEALKT